MRVVPRSSCVRVWCEVCVLVAFPYLHETQQRDFLPHLQLVRREVRLKHARSRDKNVGSHVGKSLVFLVTYKNVKDEDCFRNLKKYKRFEKLV